MAFFSGAQIPPGLYAALESKKLPLNVMRKIVLEGHRFGAAEAFNERIIDVISPKPEEKVDNGPAKTLETSIELAIRLAPKAGKDAYGSNKVRFGAVVEGYTDEFVVGNARTIPRDIA